MNDPVLITGDGSHTIVGEREDITFHSRNGALTESRHVFIDHGLAYCANLSNDVSILEIGFGTGLNALLAYDFVLRHPECSVSYTGIEKYPLNPSIVRRLNYPALVHMDPLFYERMHTQSSFSEGPFHFDLFTVDALEFAFPARQYHCVFLDAFAPDVQPELWSDFFLGKIRDGMVDGGVLVTYSAQGQFRRSLRSLGFTTERLPGPPGKREMTRAVLEQA